MKVTIVGQIECNKPGESLEEKIAEGRENFAGTETVINEFKPDGSFFVVLED